MRDKSNFKSVATTGVILFLITGIAALILAFVNNVTAPMIKKNEEAKQSAAMMAVMPEADRFNKVEKAYEKNEKVINDFLLQFAYTLMIGVISIFMYNAANFRYGSGAYDFSNKLMWIVFAISLILCILFAALYKIKSNGKYKIALFFPWTDPNYRKPNNDLLKTKKSLLHT